MFIGISRIGDLFCKETRVSFGPNYYTLFFDKSTDVINQAINNFGNHENKFGAAIELISPDDKADPKLLKALITGSTFPGSGVETVDALANANENQLMNWIKAFPKAFPKEIVDKLKNKYKTAPSWEDPEDEDEEGKQPHPDQKKGRGRARAV